ncbi:hypothetical protein KM043_007768 [Ampulex compressa]|nr:hypothetical protein KM043_007768 [Ampulex compressa]
MFKCCVCNKSSKKEKSAAELTKSATPQHHHNQRRKSADAVVPNVEAKQEENRTIVREDKLNGDVQRSEVKSPSMEEDRAAKTECPLPLENGVRTEEKGEKIQVEETRIPNEEDVDKREEDYSEDKKVPSKEDVEVADTKVEEKVTENGVGVVLQEQIVDSKKIGVVKTNLYDASAYIERTIDDGPEEEGDDSVFEACPADSEPHKKTPPVTRIPRWLSEEEDGEHDSEGCSGMQEPPATPVARDELALRRHRFFSDLLHATQNTTEHRVRFDPLGPMVHAGCETSDREEHLEELVNRLENVTRRLEKVPIQSATKTQETAVQTSTPSPKKPNPVGNSGRIQQHTVAVQSQLEEVAPPVPINMSVAGYEDLLSGPVKDYLQLSEKIGGDVATHSKLVEKAFQIQLQFIRTAASRPIPANQSEQLTLLAPTSSQIQQIQEFREKNRGSAFFNHLSAISESIPALGWVAVSPTPAPYVKEMNDAGQFYTNRVLKDWKEKDKIHIEWCKAWVQTLTDLQQYVRQHHTTGLVWAKTGSVPTGIPPPPPPSMPIGDVAPVINDDRSALFAEINQGEGITKNLKKVTSDMQTHKNPSLRTGPAPFKAPVVGNAVPGKIVPPANAPIDKPPVFTRDGKKWLVEYHKGNKDLLVENAEMNNVVYMFRCQDSTLVVKGKINSVIMDSCRKSSIVFDSVVSSIEFVNCQSVQMQVSLAIRVAAVVYILKADSSINIGVYD